MHLWQVKINMGLFTIGILYQFLDNGCIIEKVKLIGPHFYFLCHAGMRIHIVIGTELSLVQYFIYQFTTIAAKGFVLQPDGGGYTFFATMITGFFYGMNSLFQTDWYFIVPY